MLRLLAVAAGMFAFGFLLVPLYDVLCEVTGFNGKTAGRYEAEGEQAVDEGRLVTVQFIASNNGAMPWDFRPKVRSMQVHPGQMYATDFHARNGTGRAMVAQAVPSVTPFRAAAYLHKTECFCFEQQRLEAGESLDMPLRFIVDTQLPADVTRLTLSYTLFNVDTPAAGAVDTPAAGAVDAQLPADVTRLALSYTLSDATAAFEAAASP